MAPRAPGTGPLPAIRAATLADVDILWPLVEAFLASAPLPLPADQDAVSALLQTCCAAEDTCVLLAEAPQGCDGFLVAHLVPYALNPAVTVVQEQAFFVAATARRRGVGVALLTALEVWAAARGVQACILSGFEESPGLVRFYAGQGYRPLERHFVKEL